MLLWMDGFDHYGASDEAPMSDGVYAQAVGSIALSTTNPRTGTHALRESSASVGSPLLRRILGAAYTTVGLGMAYWCDSLPSNNDKVALFHFNDASNVCNVAIVVHSTGAIRAQRGSGYNSDTTRLAQSADGVITAGAYQHVEAKVYIHDTEGAVEVRVNGVTVLSASGVDTRAGLGECSQVKVMSSVGTNNAAIGTGYHYIDDLYCWNDQGDTNNDFLGDRRVYTIFPEEDTSTAGWTAVGDSTPVACIDDTGPDDDTTYIMAEPLIGSPPDPVVSEFTLQDLPVDAAISSISAIQVYGRTRKTEAGITNIKMDLVQGADVSEGADNEITELYTYRMDMHELDPATGSPFTKDGVGSLKLRITRTA